METVLPIVLPVFGLLFVGFGAARAGLVKDNVADGLSDFVFTVAVPCLLFKTLATADIPEASPWGYWFAYFSGVAVAWLVASFSVIRIFGRDGRTAVVSGFSAGQGNTVLIGIPLILVAYGDAGKVPIFLLLAIHLPLMMTVATLGIELASPGGRKPLGAVLRSLSVSIATHPIIIGIALGVVWRFTGWELPEVPLKLIDSLGSTAVPCALFSSGMALKRYGIAGDVRITVLVSFLKLVIHPAIFLALGWALGLPPVWIGAGLLFAACPTGINAYLVANRYGTGIRIASSTIALSTMVAVISVSGWLLMTGALGL
ncbi:MAG: AEC family transporter [Hyphomicrobiaceae bacterium]|nr:AEC family transporter [Hyphomicrobiaceae bacterium]